ncbi:PfkB family carbohydrate kinase [Georgenia subflava]|uniref:PfkB family carbohydrate kinase n=1 Tax=Georgenia subflava TaxID=1622177 RepID=UPI00187B1CDA|nr:PfkB family carbohydrate kinase [Georgenia subflava]
MKAPAVHDPFRRPSTDPTLGQGLQAPTTPAWAPTPTLTDRSSLDAPGLVVGEVLIDTHEHEDGRSEHLSGAGANVAIGLARLGRPVELVTSFGADSHGVTARALLERENVQVAPGSDRASRTSTVQVQPGQDTGASPADLVWEPPNARLTRYPLVVHVGSLGAVLEPGSRTVAGIIAAYRPGATITYDPALHPEIIDSPEDARSLVEGLLARADLVKVCTRDLSWLYPGEDHKAVARRWLTSGPGIVVIDMGAEGAWAVNSVGEVATASGHGFGVADTAGAGDAFMAALIDALWNGGLLGVAAREDLHTLRQGSLQALIDHATTAAAITASRPRGNPPTRAELDAGHGIPQVTARPGQ